MRTLRRARARAMTERPRRRPGDRGRFGQGIVEQAVACSRPGAEILLFAQTSHQERMEVSGADICMGERILCGSYSASVDLQKESAELVFAGLCRWKS